MAPLLKVLLVGLVTSSAGQVYTQPVFDAKNATGITYAQGLTCSATQTDCKAIDLKLEVYWPVAKAGGPEVPKLKPAYILAHGGGNSGGSKEQGCVQGSAAFYASRGFVGFNIDYRLAGQHGLFPKRSWNIPAGTGLVSHIARNDDRFWPHPRFGGPPEGKPFNGTLQLGDEGGELSPMCISKGDNVSLSLQVCNASDARQVWHMDAFTPFPPQKIVHKASGLCLDIPSAGPFPAAGLPIEVASCIDGATQDNTQMWQLGYSGALLTRNGAMTVQAARNLGDWEPDWYSGYPATRDSKAAVRFVRANAAKFGVDPDRIAVSGGSAGATNMVAVGVTFDGDYKDEISVKDDPTLATTNMNVSSQVQCVVAHWSSDGEIALAQQHDPLSRTRYSKENAPIIEFHGSTDTTIPIARAEAVQDEYAKTGVDYEMRVLRGCGHGAWCYDGKGKCDCDQGPTQGYGDMMDSIALPFVAKHLKLELVGKPICPGGSYTACFVMCPSDPSKLDACLTECHKLCDNATGLQTLV